jgi:glycosyltransferase involved in cell wall biosynthesis
MTSIRVLYDGRPLLHDPLGPPACHLYEILTGLPPQVQPLLALLGEPPAWMPPQVEVLPAADVDGLAWEQRLLPQLARRLQADLLHIVGNAAPLLGAERVLVSPAGWPRRRSQAGLRERLRWAMGRGGLARALGMAWPELLPPPQDFRTTFQLPMRVHPGFVSKGFRFPPEIPGVNDLPGNYFLFHGPADGETLRLALEAWTWAAGPVGDVHPLLMLGIPQARHARLAELVRRHHLGETVVVLPPVSLEHLAALYRGASAIFHPAEAAPWGGALAWGMACGLPVVGHDLPLASALAGSAAYLVDPQDTRGLGAALISVVVKEQLRKQLREAALARARRWRESTIGQALAALYARLVSVRQTG